MLGISENANLDDTAQVAENKKEKGDNDARLSHHALFLVRLS